MQVYNLIINGYFCIGFIDFMLKGKSLVDYIKLFSPNDYERNDKITIGITSTAVGLKDCAITGRIKKCKSIIKKKKKKQDKIIFLRKSKLNRIEVLISKGLIDSVVSHDEFV